MANKHELENLMRSTMENLRDMIDVNTVVGDVVELQDGGCIIPISKVTLGFASGGSEFGEKDSTTEESGYPFGGGSGAGVSVKPVAFLVIKDDFVRLLNSLNPIIFKILSTFFKIKNFDNKFNPIFKDKYIINISIMCILTINIAKIIYMLFLIKKSSIPIRGGAH